MQGFGYIAVAVLNIFFFIMAAGCTHQSSPLPQQIVKQQIKQGGQLVYGSLQEPNTLNPLLSDLLATSEVGSLIFSGLVQTNEKGEWVPDLAAEVPSVQNGGVSRDGHTVTYKLRQGISWHDGQPFTAEDVVFTWQTIMNRKTNVVSREGYDQIASIDTPDKYMVIIHFNEYYAPFLHLFSTILPKHILENEADINKASFNRSPVGTGPFKLKEWRVAEGIILEANTNYFKGKPNLDGITYKIIPDTNILLAQLKAGTLDIVNNLPFVQLEQVKAIDLVHTIITPNMVWEHLDFNLDNEFFRDVKIRRAIALAIDRQALINSTLKNAASSAVGDQSPLSWAYNPTLTPPPRNINMAKELLTQAGFTQGEDGIFAKDGRKLSFSLATTSENRMREIVAQAIAQQLKEAGIEVEVKFIDSTEFFNEILKKRRFETAMYAFTGGVDPDNINLWHSKKIPYRGNSYEGQNYAGWQNSEIDVLTVQGVHSVDIEKRKEAYFKIQEIIQEEYPVIPLYFRANIDAVKNSVTNYKPNPTPSGNLWNAWQWGFVETGK